MDTGILYKHFTTIENKTTHAEICVLFSHKKQESAINVKVEFGEEERKKSLGITYV